MTDPMWSNGVVRLYHADAGVLPLPDQSVHCVVTSPPYWGLRDYGLGLWDGGDPGCQHLQRPQPANVRRAIGGPFNENHVLDPWMGGVCGRCGATKLNGGIGAEATLAEHIANLVEVFREIWRVLRNDGTVWLNYGDAYAGGGRGSGDYREDKVKQGTHAGSMGLAREKGSGLAAKQLMGLPWRVAFALQDDGWWLRRDIIWNKPNPMPEAVRDRPSSAHEYVFLLTKGPQYFYDADAIRTPTKDPDDDRRRIMLQTNFHGFNDRWDGMTKEEQAAGGANARDVWTIATQSRSEEHYASFPDELPRRCILAGTSARGVCAICGAPWERVVERVPSGYDGHIYGERAVAVSTSTGGTQRSTLGSSNGKLTASHRSLGWQPTCDHDALVVPATVLDPFVGSGTTVVVAQQLGRDGIGVDLSEEYLAIARRRVEAVPLPMRGMA